MRLKGFKLFCLNQRIYVQPNAMMLKKMLLETEEKRVRKRNLIEIRSPVGL